MSDELKTALDKALSRIAALESGRSAPAAPQFDQAAFQRALTADPVGTMTRMGIPIEHVTKVFVAHAMGNEAPPALQMYAQMGPQVSATQALSSDLQAVRQRLEAIDARENKQATRTSFSALAVDKTKYPHLATAMATNPKLFDSDMEGHQGNAAELAERIEKRLADTAVALGAKPLTPPASTENADGATGQSTQAKQAQSGQVDMTPPPIQQNKAGVFTQEEAQALKDRIVKKYS